MKKVSNFNFGRFKKYAINKKFRNEIKFSWWGTTSGSVFTWRRAS